MSKWIFLYMDPEDSDDDTKYRRNDGMDWEEWYDGEWWWAGDDKCLLLELIFSTKDQFEDDEWLKIYEE